MQNLLEHRRCRLLKVSSREIVGTFSPTLVKPELFIPALEDLLVLARARPPREKGAPRRGRWLPAALWAAAGVSALAAYGAQMKWPLVDAEPLAAGGALGLAGGIALVKRLKHSVSGDAGSFLRFLWALFGLLLAGVGAGAALVPAVNAAFVWRAPVEVRGIVISVGRHDPKRETVGVVIQWDDGAVQSADMDLPVRLNGPARQVRHTGALFLEWREPPTQ